MDLVCHRCSATLDPEAYYCPECGAPQIRYVADEGEAAQSMPGVSLDIQAGAVGTGTSVSWKMAIRIAAMVGTAVGVLSAVLAAGSVLWVAVGAVVAMGIYHRRRPLTKLGPRVGARVGALLGLIAATVAFAANSVLLVVQRYGLHQGTEIDTQLTSIVKQAAARAATMDPQAPVTSFTNFWLSAEGRIGLILLTMAFLSLLIVLFAIAGGVLGAQIYRSSRGNKALS
ncbi:MAG TPA: zinc ribbon domain-containing protein [Acidobacteriaceae bacterium]|nr:zinc ribbon domain-containing protein [Acidobacteriaceae bacterium]